MNNKYNFSKVINRRNTFSSKWNVKEYELPMWVADMDFKTSPQIISALEKKIKFGIYGYEDISLEWKNSIISWWKNEHDLSISKDSLLFSTGVIPSISSLVRALTNENDNVVTLTPVYDIFFHSIENNKRKVLECPIDYKDNTYSLDFNKLENILKTPNTSLLILCNPHNPIGKIWTKEELKKIGELCNKYNVKVISDEIHCDLTRNNKKYIPFIKASKLNKEIAITCISPTKTFNLAGIQTSAIIVSNKDLYKKVYKAINNDEIAEPNIIAQIATIAAYNQSKEWLTNLKLYLDSNIELVNSYIKEKEIPIYVIPCEATYLLWIDVSKITNDASQLAKYIRKETGLYLNEGNKYRGNGNLFLRINIACPKSTLKDGLSRLNRGIKAFIKSNQ